MTKQIPPQRKRVLDFVEAEIDAGRPFPSRSAIATHMGWKHETSATDALNWLSYDGHLVRTWNGKSHQFSLPQGVSS